MSTTYIIQVTRNGVGLPTFFLDANVQGITSRAVAARIALSVMTTAIPTFLREDMEGNLDALAAGQEFHIFAANAEAKPTGDEAALAAGRLLQAAESRDPSIDRTTLRAVAEATARHGAAYGRGMLEGLWYTLGNRRDSRHPMGFHPTWTVGKLAFGEGESAYLGDEGDTTFGLDPRFVAAKGA